MAARINANGILYNNKDHAARLLLSIRYRRRREDLHLTGKRRVLAGQLRRAHEWDRMKHKQTARMRLYQGAGQTQLREVVDVSIMDAAPEKAAGV